MRLRQGGALDARGVVVSTELLQKVLDAFRPDEELSPHLPACLFSEARFSDDADFREAQFSRSASFNGVQFEGDAKFGRAQFLGEANFDGAHFFGAADFHDLRPRTTIRTQFRDQARFAGAQFDRTADFGGVQFLGGAYFAKARFCGETNFGGTSFSRYTSFDGAHFSGEAFPVHFTAATFNNGGTFEKVHFSGDVYFGGTRFEGDAKFTESVFRQRIALGPLVGSGALGFDNAIFEQGLRLEACVPRLSCKRTRFGGRADLNLRWTEVVLDDATFVQRSRLAGVGEYYGVHDSPAQVRRGDGQLDSDPRPRLLSLRQADVENLALGNLDLCACCFFGAHGLDQLRIEADCTFAQPPGRWRTRRQTLAEEQHWRADRGAGKGWHPPECKLASWVKPDAQVLDPPRIASLYRALRKALEDRKDEPGAADFYYSEMEMRRYRAIEAIRPWSRLSGERALLGLYWLISGYGLRASRALLALILTIGASAAALSCWGFQAHGPEHGYCRALLFALDSSISLLRAPTVSLTPAGQCIDIALRLAGPFFFGLALISIRGRVKR